MFGAPLFPPNLPSIPRCFWTEEITMATGPNQRHPTTPRLKMPGVHGRRRWRFKDVGPTLVTWLQIVQRGTPVGRALNVGPQAGDFHTGGFDGWFRNPWVSTTGLGMYPLKTLLKFQIFMRYILHIYWRFQPSTGNHREDSGLIRDYPHLDTLKTPLKSLIMLRDGSRHDRYTWGYIYIYIYIYLPGTPKGCYMNGPECPLTNPWGHIGTS